MTKDWSFATRAIHVGQEADPATGAVTVPIFQTSTYQQEAVGKFAFSDYARVDNPTRSALQTCLADLEGARFGLAFASGMAATDALLRTLNIGDHVIMGLDAYGGTYRLMTKVLGRHGLKISTVDLNDADAIRAVTTPATKMIWVETPTNPLLTIVDIEQMAELAHSINALLVVDNTFATPYLQQPIALGADIVVHSTTKYIGGHSDVVGGFLALNDEALMHELKFLQKAVGAIPGPMDCYLLLRGVKTLSVRMDRHCSNAARVAQFLQTHNAVDHIYFPGLPEHRLHEVARRQIRDFGGMVSFTLHGGAAAASTVAESTSVFTLAESLGAVESLIEVPGLMTHASTVDSPLEVPASLVRLSVGIEDIDDLVADLANAFSAID